MTVYRPKWRKAWKTHTWYYRFLAGKKINRAGKEVAIVYERGGYPTKREAQLAEWDRRGEVGARGPRNQPPPGAGPDARLADYATRWLARLAEDVARGDLAPRTLQSYRELLDTHILPALGRLPLSAVTRPQILQFLTERRGALAKNSVRLLRATLSSLFTDALERGDVTAHPVIASGKRRRGQRATDVERVAAIRPMTREQRDLFLSAAWGTGIEKAWASGSSASSSAPAVEIRSNVTASRRFSARPVTPGSPSTSGTGASSSSTSSDPYPSSPGGIARSGVSGESPEPAKSPYPLLFELLAKCGLRPGEAFGLQVGDVDLAAGTVRVERAWDGQVARPTKTHQARRVDLTPGLVERLREWIGRLPQVDVLEPAAAGDTQAVVVHSKRGRAVVDGAWLLPNGAGRPLELRRVRRHFRAALRAAGLPRFRLYDLRHTYATLRLLDGAPPLYVAAQMGHRDALTTMRHYAKWIPGGDRRWVEDDQPAPPRSGVVVGLRSRGRGSASTTSEGSPARMPRHPRRPR